MPHALSCERSLLQLWTQGDPSLAMCDHSGRSKGAARLRRSSFVYMPCISPSMMDGEMSASVTGSRSNESEVASGQLQPLARVQIVKILR